MALLTDEVRSFIGRQSEAATAYDPVEAGAVRRYAQAIMDENPRYAAGREDERTGGPVAPPLYPAFMFRRPLGTPDSLSERADDPDFDGLVVAASSGLPELPIKLALLNGGAEVELYRYARHGERVTQRSRYADIYERESKSGPMLLVVVETEYRAGDGELLLRVRGTTIRR